MSPLDLFAYVLALGGGLLAVVVLAFFTYALLCILSSVFFGSGG